MIPFQSVCVGGILILKLIFWSGMVMVRNLILCSVTHFCVDFDV